MSDLCLSGIIFFRESSSLLSNNLYNQLYIFYCYLRVNKKLDDFFLFIYNVTIFTGHDLCNSIIMKIKLYPEAIF